MNNKQLAEIVGRKLTTKMDINREYSDAQLKKIIEQCVFDLTHKIPMIEIDQNVLVQDVFNDRRRMGIIQPLIEDEEVNEIMINGTDGIFIEKNGALLECEYRYSSKEELFASVQNMLSWANRTVNESNPIADGRLSGGARINVVLDPPAINGPIVTIRKFTKKNYTMQDFISNGTLKKDQAEYLIKAVKSEKSIVISGGTSTGKTTFMNMLCSYIPEDMRIITIEDSAELNLAQKNIVRLETKNANTEGYGEIKMRALIKTALRMRPDRLIIGEVRDESALELLTAMSTGHRGSMSTIHANSAEDTLVRLETMALWEGHVHSKAINRMIISGVDIVVFLKRNQNGRFVHEIAEVNKDNENEKVVTYVFLSGK